MDSVRIYFLFLKLTENLSLKFHTEFISFGKFCFVLVKFVFKEIKAFFSSIIMYLLILRNRLNDVTIYQK